MNIIDKSKKTMFIRVLAAALCFVLCFTFFPWMSTGGTANAGSTAQQSNEYHGEFGISSEIDGVTKYTFDYDDNWFFSSGNELNYDLLKMSVRVATASAYSVYIKPMMESIKYGNIVTKYNANTNQDINNISYAIGSKNIKNESGEEISVIMVVVRSICYSAYEWGGNAFLGESGDHEGFDIAANTLFNAIDNYLKTYNSDLLDKKKIWVSGYSRGGAVANLLGKKLNEKSFTYSDGFKFDSDNIFVHCFESPTSAQELTKKYKNVVNVVNPIDLVTKLVECDWGFYRVGNSYYIPTINADGAKYLSYKSKMVKEYGKLLEYNGLPASQARTLTDATFAFQNNLDKIFYFLTKEVGSRANYVEKYQSGLIEALKVSLGTRSEYDKLLLAFRDVLPGTVAKMGVYWLANPLQFTLIIDMLMKNYAEPHYPELEISWIDSMDAETFKSRADKVRYKKLLINCLADIIVTDEVGNVVAKVVNGVVDEVIQRISVDVDDSGQVMIILPEEGKYNVKISSDDKEKVSITASDYNYETREVERIVKYEDVKVNEGEVLTYSSNEDKDGTVADDSLSSSRKSLIRPTADVKN